MAWRRPGDKPLSEPITVNLLTHICVTRPQWVKGHELGHHCACRWLNTLRPRQHGCHFADNTFNRIFLNENVRISISISLKFVPKGLINNIQALVQIMAWRRPGDKPLSEPITVNLLTHICVTRPQWVKGHELGHHCACRWLNTLRPRQHGCHFADNTFNRIFLNENVRIWIEISLKFVSKGPINNIPALVQLMAWCQLGDKPLSEPMMIRLPTQICVTRPQWVNTWQC